MLPESSTTTRALLLVSDTFSKPISVFPFMCRDLAPTFLTSTPSTFTFSKLTVPSPKSTFSFPVIFKFLRVIVSLSVAVDIFKSKLPVILVTPVAGPTFDVFSEIVKFSV